MCEVIYSFVVCGCVRVSLYLYVRFLYIRMCEVQYAALERFLWLHARDKRDMQWMHAHICAFLRESVCVCVCMHAYLQMLTYMHAYSAYMHAHSCILHACTFMHSTCMHIHAFYMHAHSCILHACTFIHSAGMEACCSDYKTNCAHVRRKHTGIHMRVDTRHITCSFTTGIYMHIGTRDITWSFAPWLVLSRQ